MDKRLTEIKEGIVKLRKKADLRERVIGNIEKLKFLSDDQIQLDSNNRRYRYDFTIIRSRDTRLNRQVDGVQGIYAMEALAFVGDQLCQKIVEYYENCSLDPTRLFCSFDLARKFALRQITEKEYNSYLNGELPFTKDIYGKEHRLEIEAELT